MKKVFSASMLSMMMSMMLMFSGCSNDETPAEPDPPAESDPSADSELETPAAVPVDFDQLAPPAVGDEYAVITTDFGVIELRLFPEVAPKAVENFVTHAKNGYYDGLIFHRVVQDFVIQTGDPMGTGMGGESIYGEGFMIEPNSQARHFNGALGMARGEDPSSQGSQFYIVQNNQLPDAFAQDFTAMRDQQDDDIGAEAGETYGVTVGELFPTWAIDKYLENGGTPMLDFSYTVFGQVISGMDVVEQIAAVEVNNPQETRPLTDVKMTKVEIRKWQN